MEEKEILPATTHFTYHIVDSWRPENIQLIDLFIVLCVMDCIQKY